MIISAGFIEKIFSMIPRVHTVLEVLLYVSIALAVSTLFVTVTTICGVTIFHVIQRLFNKIKITTLNLRFEWLYNKLLNIFSSKIMVDYRPIIRSAPYRPLRVDNIHSHPEAAQARTRANRWIDETCALIGYQPFSLSCSNRDIRNGNDVQRLNYFTKDLSIPTKYGQIKQNNAIKLIDVDYYIDMPNLLSKMRPTFIYTFAPTIVAGTVPNGTFFIKDNEVITHINGGSKYQHLTWDYQSDVITIDYWWGSAIYLVEQMLQSAETHRRIIFLNPIRKVYGPFAWLLPGFRLKRTNYTFDGVNVIRNQYCTDNGVQVDMSLSLSGSPCCIIAREDILTASIIRCNLSKDPSISDVERIFRQHSISTPDIAAALFIQLYKEKPKILHMAMSTITTPHRCDLDLHTYQTTYPLVMEDGKPTARQILKPLFPSGFAPARSHNNDHACLRGRIETKRNPNKPVPPFFIKCRQEFLEYLIPTHLVHSFAPLTESEVEEHQNRPTQRALAERAKPFSHYLKFIVKAFQKAEIYGKLHFPRNISTVPTDHKMRFSAFVYPIADRLKDFKWYAFGQNPREITESILTVCQNTREIIPTDYECFDGTHGEFKHEFDLMLYARAYHPDYHGEVLQLKEVMRNAHAVTTTGVKYNTGTTVLSGGADTSTANTYINCLLSYISLRVTGYQSSEAISKLGLYGGDDGLNGHVSETTLVKVASKLGYIIKASTIKAGAPVPFLGRVFLDPWSTPASICDVPRRLRSLHLTTTPKFVPDDLVLFRKAESYLITDPHTPLITAWCRMIQRLCKPTNTEAFNTFLRMERPYYCDPHNNWTTPTQIEYDFAKVLVARELNSSVSEINRLIELMRKSKKLDDFEFKFMADPVVKMDCVVGGVVFKA